MFFHSFDDAPEGRSLRVGSPVNHSFTSPMCEVVIEDLLVVGQTGYVQRPMIGSQKPIIQEILNDVPSTSHASGVGKTLNEKTCVPS
jgi:hypothetical protein